MPIEINKRYIRTSPKGEETIQIISTTEQVAYHTDLEKEGFQYKEVTPVQATGGTCLGCEG